MSTFGYHEELKKYEELDEEQILATLSSEELQELERELADLDPDRNVPIGLRQKDQTAKIPTGTFDREALLKYWEDENKNLSGCESEESNSRQEDEPEATKKDQVTLTSRNTEKHLDHNSNMVSNKDKSALSEKSTKSKEERKNKVDPSRSKKHITQDLNGDISTENTDQNLDGAPQRPSGNPIVIDKALEQVLTDDPTMNEVNLNNIEDISQETLIRFAEALSTNTHVHVFSLANTHADDQVALALSKMLCKNCSIKILNIESNFVSGQGILALVAALKHNRTLMELRFHNQRHICGGKAEMEMVQLLRENTTLLKLGYQFDLPGPRMTATGLLTRNQDQQRQKRLQQKKEQNPPEEKEKVSGPSAETRSSKKPLQLSKTATEKHNKNINSTTNSPTRKISETVKQHETLKSQWNQGKTKAKKCKNGSNEKESADILKDLRDALKPSLHKKQAEPSHLPPPQRTSRDDLMAAIRGSSVHSLKRVDFSQT